MVKGCERRVVVYKANDSKYFLRGVFFYEARGVRQKLQENRHNGRGKPHNKRKCALVTERKQEKGIFMGFARGNFGFLLRVVKRCHLLCYRKFVKVLIFASKCGRIRATREKFSFLYV